MIEGIILWFTTSKVGRAVAAGLAIAAAIGIAVLKVFNAGKATERAKQDRQSIDNFKKRQDTDADINGLGHADVDERLSRWVRDDK